MTFLFTDLEGSTRLWEEHPQEMKDALARHNTIVRAAVESHNGVVFSTMGDGMAAAFASARDAVHGVLAAQVELTAEDWGQVTGPLAARMGLLTDEGVLGGEHYLNQPLNRCARLMAAAHGGQALVSGATELLVRDAMPDGCALVDLGEHRLRDITRPVRIFQLTAPGLRREFPPLRSLEAPAGNLPIQLSSFVGRVDELTGLARAVRRSPLVTVAGVGGVGKTRLVLQAAAQLLPFFHDGAWLCELDTADDGETMMQAVLAALRARPRPGISLASSIAEFLHTRNVLLLLDNCEHLMSAPGALAAEILRTCREVRILATSRQPLDVDGEQVFRLPPLSVPAPSAGMQTVAASDAVSLFVQRASAARSGFCLDPGNIAAVGEICRRLDGIPLAIELAAARVSALQPGEIARLLDERFRLLTRGRTDVAGRHQTLQATIEWSHALLGETERRIFDCLGVFPGSFDAAAAAAVASADGIGRWDVLDGLTALVGKSMVTEDEGPNQTSRYRLLETVRAYAREQMVRSGEADDLNRRHGEYFLGLMSSPDWPTTAWRFDTRIDLYTADVDNFQAALAWSRTQEPQVQLRLAVGLAPLWMSLGRFAEGRSAISRAIERAPEGPLALQGLERLGWLAVEHGDLDAALEAAGAILAAEPLTGTARGQALALKAFATLQKGDRVASRAMFDAALENYESAGDRFGIASTRYRQAVYSLQAGDLADAERLFAKVIQAADGPGFGHLAVYALLPIVPVLLASGRVGEAEQRWHQAYALAGESHSAVIRIGLLAYAATIAAARGRGGLAATLDRAVGRLLAETGWTPERSMETLYRQTIAEAVARLSPQALLDAQCVGDEMTAEKAIAYAALHTDRG